MSDILPYHDDIAQEALGIIVNARKRATAMNDVLHSKLKEQLDETMITIRENMISRFAIVLPYDKAQSMLMGETTCNIMQIAGGKMEPQYTSYEYKLGGKVTIRINCHGGKKMPSILFPNKELTIFSEEFLDLVRPLYSITKSWVDVQLAFDAVCKLVQDTRELNFYIPWIRYLFPENRDLTNEFNAPYRITQWLDLNKERNSTIAMITRQIKYILNNEHTSKRTWMPSELVQMVRQGGELITQYNIMKAIPTPDTFIKEDQASIQVIINIVDHPTVKWAAEAHAHRTMKEANRLKERGEEAERLVEIERRKSR
jgi:hypothetical protein